MISFTAELRAQKLNYNGKKYHFLSVLGVSSKAGGGKKFDKAIIQIIRKGFSRCLLHLKKH
jgi:hypothetical protein